MLMKRFILGSVTFLSIMTFASNSAEGRVNPLLVPSEAPYQAIPFDKITIEDYEQAIMEGIRLHEKEIEEITSNKEPATFENTVAALDRSGKIANRAIMTLSNLESALGDTALMNVMTKMMPVISRHATEQLLNEKLWNRIKSVYESRKNRSDLTKEELRLIEETYRGYADNGANLEGADRDKFKKLNSELSDLNVKFSQNVTNGMKDPARRMWISEQDTLGLPESIKNAAREAAREAFAEDGLEDDKTKFLITIFAPSYVPFMKYSDNRDLRERLYRLYNSRNTEGEFDNTQILKDIANIRLEIARLMGKKNYAEYHLQGTMAATPDNVMKLLESLKDSYTEPMKQEIAMIENYASKTEGEGFKLMPWDYSYWANKLKNDKYAFNDEDMKPYFELKNTIDGVFGLATKLYGYTFKENKDIPVYHPDVKAYEVYEKDGSILGVLYADFFYRPGKGPGAWMTEFRAETKDNAGKRDIPLISIVTNFSKPVGDEPVLLTPSEVETFLHEFGHALHGLSAQATYATLSGTNVYHDFVELFSQFNENFLTEKEFLDSFAKHYKTGEKMPEELIDRFIHSRQFGASYACMRQLGFGYLDMAYHTIEEPLRCSLDVEEYEAKAQDPVRVFDAVEGCVTSPSFGHIFSGGYAAGYYGYKWAEVLDADAFAAFKESGIFNEETASRFKKMLQAGGTVDPMELYKEFRGKEPSVDALLHRDGIK